MAAAALPAAVPVRRPSPWVLLLPLGIVLALLPPELSLTMLAAAVGATDACLADALAAEVARFYEPGAVSPAGKPAPLR